MKKEYDTFIQKLEDLAPGQEKELVLRDLTPGPGKYEALYVNGVVSPEKLPQGDVLWLRFPTGKLHPQPWSLKILQKLKGLPSGS